VIPLLMSILLAVLPMPGTTFKQLPAGTGKASVEAACYACHSADLLVQQRLTEKQWIATVDKMIRWGAVVPDGEKEAMVRYLARNFGPGSRSVPLKVAPVAR